MSEMSPPAVAPRTPTRSATRQAEPVLEIRELNVDYGFGTEAIHAVVGCDLVLRRGQVVGLAGESGSGKSTLST
jgi:peptide/nickel transport system ATP-binding protein